MRKKAGSYLRHQRSDVEIERAARKAGIIASAITPMYRKARPRSGLMLGFSGFPTQMIKPAAARLAAVVARAAAADRRSA